MQHKEPHFIKQFLENKHLHNHYGFLFYTELKMFGLFSILVLRIFYRNKVCRDRIGKIRYLQISPLYIITGKHQFKLNKESLLLITSGKIVIIFLNSLSDYSRLPLHKMRMLSCFLLPESSNLKTD